MAGLSCLCTCDLERGRNEVPGRRLAQTFVRCESRANFVAPPIERRAGELEPLAKHKQQVGESLERRRLDAALDAADRVLARPPAQREPPLADAISRSRLP